MKTNNVLKLIESGEGENIEFKESKNKLSKDVYETICAFLNKKGGHIFLGVKDDKTIIGVNENYVEQIKKNFVSAMNNSQIIIPSIYLEIEEHEINDKTILYISVPKSSQVHRCKNRIYTRNEDGDFDITDNTTLVSNLYANKQSSYIENTIYQAVNIEDLDTSWFDKVRKRVQLIRNDHPWITMSDIELLKSAGLHLKDPNTGIEGITLAGILIFGTENLILTVLPHYRTDAILRVDNLDRYDDRDDIRTNLLSSYERLMSFVNKHLDDKFYMEGDLRISLRDKIFREAVSNMLIHRDFSNPFPAKFIVEKEQVYIENANKPNGYGLIDPYNFSPFPKNPTIARFFKEIGLVEELGSGIRNIFKYNKIYSGAEPRFIEGDLFKIYIPLVDEDNKNNGLNLDTTDYKLLRFVEENPTISVRELEEKLPIKKTAINDRISKLVDDGILENSGTTKNPVYIIIKDINSDKK